MALARRLIERGARVGLCGLPAGPKPELSAQQSFTLLGDVADPEFQDRLIGETLTRFGRIDVLINNAGVGLYQPSYRSDLALTRRMFDVNLFAPLELVQKALPSLRAAPQGMVVNISSVGAWAGLPWATMYCATKYAMHGFSEGLYRELGPQGIHVLTVVPGIIETSFRTNILGGKIPDTVKSIRGGIPADSLAQAIIRGMASRRRYVIKPWTALPFGLINWLAPAVVDWYCASKGKEG